MANDLDANPLRVDTAATIISKPTLIQAIQWVDDDAAAGGVIANTEDFVMTIDGTTVQCNVVAVATQLAGAMAYNLSLAVPIRVNSLIVVSIDGGTLLIWKA